MTDPAVLLCRAGLSASAPAERLTGGDMGDVWRLGPYVVKTHFGARQGITRATEDVDARGESQRARRSQRRRTHRYVEAATEDESGSRRVQRRPNRRVVPCRAPTPPPGLYAAEARGLAALRAAGVRAPDPIWHATDGIIMPYMPPIPDGMSIDATDDDLAHQLAALHRTPADTYGWDHPVYLGRFPLPAAPRSTDWASFWRQNRLRPLYAATRRALGPLADATARFIDRFDPPTEGPTLIHGDLWSGNTLATADGAALIDPSAWHGERAVDLAMMQLFGGFSRRVWQTYRRLYPIPPAVEAALPGYQLYFVLVHLHFFGAVYLGSVRRIVGDSR